jgi:hypothetical protein
MHFPLLPCVIHALPLPPSWDYHKNIWLRVKNCEAPYHAVFYIPDLRFPPRLNWTLLSSVLLRGVRWFETDVSVLSIDALMPSKDKAGKLKRCFLCSLFSFYFLPLYPPDGVVSPQSNPQAQDIFSLFLVYQTYLILSPSCALCG